ncbi:MAG: hypothetical protein HWN67_04995 [Candidatus Helarchaeota archaeon]|nr:hypothetical protein [Candidatus Helarchaeota archaeon]
MELASQLRSKKKFFNFDDIYILCTSKLSNSKEEILRSLNYLYQKGYLVEGASVTKANVLENVKRNQIYDYVKNNPGAHVREIQRSFNIGSFIAFRHLKYLEKFGYLRSKKFMNKKAYFLLEFDETQDEKILVLKNERTKLIFDHIVRYEKIRLANLERYLSLSHGQIQPHLKKLLEFNLINSIIENKIIYYSPKISEPTEIVTVKREFDYLGGNIRFKVAVQNNTEMSISNILVTLNPSDQFFWDESVQKITNLPPHNSRGVDFTLIPNTCGKSTIFGAVSYQDAYGNAHTLTINPKEIAIKCPLVIPQSMSEYEIIEWIKKLKKSTTKIDSIDKNLKLIEGIYALSILSYVIVLHKANGLAIYQEQLGSVKLDADLISGFVIAIQSFGTEISKKETPVTGLKYKTYNIEIETGDYIQALLLINGKANEYLVRSLFIFVKEFEKQFEDQLKSFAGNISQFRNTKEIFYRVFDFS